MKIQIWAGIVYALVVFQYTDAYVDGEMQSSLPVCFSHLDTFADFQCPQPFKTFDGKYVPSRLLQRQIKPGMDAHFGGFHVRTDEHIIQLCYHHGTESTKLLEKFDVALVTFGTIDRLASLRDTLSTWSGLIYLALFIRSGLDIKTIEDFLQTNADAQQRLTLHLMWPVGEGADRSFPVNSLRNLALVGVPTSHFLYIDMDFVPSAGSHDEIIKHQDLLEQTVRGEKRLLFVVPAIECRRRLQPEKCAPLQDQYTNMSMEEIKSNLDARNFDLFVGREWPYHSPTELPVWLKANDPYTLPQHHARISHDFEPYTIAPTKIIKEDGSTTPFIMWDEIFTDYGRNKIVFVTMLRRIFDYEFMVLPNVAIFHKRHSPTQKAKKFKSNPGQKDDIIKLFQQRMLYWQIFSNRRWTDGVAGPRINRTYSLELATLLVNASTSDSNVNECENYGLNSNDDWRRPFVSPLLSQIQQNYQAEAVDQVKVKFYQSADSAYLDHENCIMCQSVWLSFVGLWLVACLITRLHKPRYGRKVDWILLFAVPMSALSLWILVTFLF